MYTQIQDASTHARNRDETNGLSGKTGREGLETARGLNADDVQAKMDRKIQNPADNHTVIRTGHQNCDQEEIADQPSAGKASSLERAERSAARVSRERPLGHEPWQPEDDCDQQVSQEKECAACKIRARATIPREKT